MLLHKWIEQWIVKRLERLKGLDWFRRPDQCSDPCPLARNTVAICAVANEQSLAWRCTGCSHERLEALGMRFKQPDIAGRDDVMGCQSHRSELLRRGVVRKDADRLAGTLQSSEQLRHSRKKAASQITEWPRFNPFGHDRVHPFGRHRRGLGGLGDQNAVEVDDFLGSQALS